VISSIYGEYDILKEPSGRHSSVDFYCFTNKIDATYHGKWIIISTPYHEQDMSFFPLSRNSVWSPDKRVRNMMTAKFYKQQFQNIPFLQTYNYVMWVDGAFLIRDVDIPFHVETLLSVQYDACFFKHTRRSSVEDEVLYCMNMDDTYLMTRYYDQPMSHQLLTYLDDGFRDDVGLYEMGSFIVRMGVDWLLKMFDCWWLENNLHTFQDQVSIPYCAWKTGMLHRICFLPDVYNNPWSVHKGHSWSPPPFFCKQNEVVDQRMSQKTVSIDDIAIRVGGDVSTIFETMEVCLRIPNFASQRTSAGAVSSGVEATYTRLISTGFLTAAQGNICLKYEIICELTRMVRHEELFHSFRIDRDQIVDTRGWGETLIRRFLPILGLQHAKVISRHPFMPQMASYVQQSACEKVLAAHRLPILASVVRALILVNPYQPMGLECRFWSLYARTFFPWLVVVCSQCLIRMHEIGATRLVFLSRDMFLLFHLFRKLYPYVDCRYVLSSRLSLQRRSQSYIDYLRSHVNETTLVVDLHGTGKTWQDFSKACKLVCLDFTFVIKIKSQFSENIRPICEASYEYFQKIEYLNKAYHASLLDILPGGTMKVMLVDDHTDPIIDIYYEEFFRGLDIITPVARYLSIEVMGLDAQQFIGMTATILSPILDEDNKTLIGTWDHNADLQGDFYATTPALHNASGKLVEYHVDAGAKSSHLSLKVFEKQSQVWRYTNQLLAKDRHSMSINHSLIIFILISLSFAMVLVCLYIRS